MTIKVELWKVKYYLIMKDSCTFFLKMQMVLPPMHILNITLTQMQLNIVLKQIDISFILCTLNVLLKNALCKLLMISVMNVRSNLIGDYLFSVRFYFWLVCIAIESSMNFILKLQGFATRAVFSRRLCCMRYSTDVETRWIFCSLTLLLFFFEIKLE